MNDNGRITGDKKLYVNVNRRFLDVNHLLRALRRVIQFRFVLPCPQGLALAFEGATARLVWLLFFFNYFNFYYFLFFLFIILVDLAERSLGHAGPRLSDSWIFQISRDKSRKKFSFYKKSNGRGTLSHT